MTARECSGGGSEVLTIDMADGAELPTHGICSVCGALVPIGIVKGKTLALRHEAPDLAVCRWDCPCGYFSMGPCTGGMSTIVGCPYCGRTAEIASLESGAA
jgi:hypothetical protein